MAGKFLTMRFFLIGFLLALNLVGFLGAGEKYILKKASPWDQSLSSFSFEQVDMRPLYERARTSYPGLAETDLVLRVRMNIKYIFHNKLNRERFLVAPSAEMIVRQINTIFSLSDELDQLAFEGRRLVVRQGNEEDFDTLVEEMGNKASELKASFEDFFLEGTRSSYAFRYPKTGEAASQFTHFILESEKIQGSLTRRLDDFFFGASPGAIELGDYSRSSILALSGSLCALSQLAKKEIGDSKGLR
jgi:hypothetical protein